MVPISSDAGEVVTVRSAFTDVIIPASGDYVFIVAGKSSRGQKEKDDTITNWVWKLRIWKDTRGQDLVEYALMAGFVAVAAGAIMPDVATTSLPFWWVASLIERRDLAARQG
jgi:pilus assembly protein Flp/PilA